MAVIKIKVVVSTLSEVQKLFDRIKIYRSTTGLTGTFTEITEPADRMVLETGKIVYEFSDLTGATGYFYKSSYFHSVSLLESSLSEAQQGEGDSALDIISVDELKNFYLLGIDLTIDNGEAFPESMYEWYIKAAVSWVERRLDIPIRPKSIEAEESDFYREDFIKFMFLTLKEYPVIDVEQVQLVLPGNNVIQTFDREWLYLDKDGGQVSIVPPSANAGVLVLGLAGFWPPALMWTQRFIPNAFRTKYTAGFEAGKVPEGIKHIVGMVAAMGPLNIAGDLLVGAGIAAQSLSIDGLSQSISTTSSATNAGYGARIIEYQKEIKDMIPTLTRYYKAKRMAVV
jgi:hypothetical protein